MSHPSHVLSLRVAEIRELTTHIRSLRLEGIDGQELPAFDAGAHVQVQVQLPEGAVGWRHYSLIDLPAQGPVGQSPRSYLIAVRREEAGRGGSQFMHQLQAGQELSVQPPRNDFPLQDSPAGVLLLAGGIGITPIMTMAASCVQQGVPVRVVYAGRDRQAMAFVDELSALLDERLHLHADTEAGGPLAVGDVLDSCIADEQVYVCGPQAMLDAVLAAAQQREWASKRIHFELFNAPAPAAGDHPFELVLAQSGLSITVPADRSVLDCLIDAGQDPMYDCQRGECGVCVVQVMEGEPDHRDHVLSRTERESGEVMHPCVSRCKGTRLVLDL